MSANAIRRRSVDYTPDEMMTIAAARLLWPGCVCFVGIGTPSAAANLARLRHAPDLVLIYESGTVGTKPSVLPLSIGDGELAETADCVVPLPEIFSHYLQRGRVDVGFLAGAQIDRFGNLNTTVIGDYAKPKVRLPGSGGACEIAINARKIFVMMPQSKRSFVERLDFRTSPGHLAGAGSRPAHWGAGPTVVVTGLGVYGFDEATGEMELRSLHPGVTLDDVRENTGWDLRAAGEIGETPRPTDDELRVIREELDPKGAYSG